MAPNREGGLTRPGVRRSSTRGRHSLERSTTTDRPMVVTIPPFPHRPAPRSPPRITSNSSTHTSRTTLPLRQTTLPSRPWDFFLRSTANLTYRAAWGPDKPVHLGITGNGPPPYGSLGLQEALPHEWEWILAAKAWTDKIPRGATKKPSKPPHPGVPAHLLRARSDYQPPAAGGPHNPTGPSPVRSPPHGGPQTCGNGPNESSTENHHTTPARHSSRGLRTTGHRAQRGTCPRRPEPPPASKPTTTQVPADGKPQPWTDPPPIDSAPSPPTP